MTPVQDAAKRSAMEKKREKEARNNAVTPMSENTQMEFDAILKASKHFSYKARHAFFAQSIATPWLHFSCVVLWNIAFLARLLRNSFARTP